MLEEELKDKSMTAIKDNDDEGQQWEIGGGGVSALCILVIWRPSPWMLSDWARGIWVNGRVPCNGDTVSPQIGSVSSSAMMNFYSTTEMQRQWSSSGGWMGGLLELPPSKTNISYWTSWYVRRFFLIPWGTLTSVSTCCCFSNFFLARLWQLWRAFLVVGSSK